jgi:hypothetical protein
MIIVGFRLILRGGCDPSCQRGRRDDYLPDVFVVVVTTTTFLCRGCGNDDTRFLTGHCFRRDGAVCSMIKWPGRAWGFVPPLPAIPASMILALPGGGGANVWPVRL